MTVTVEHNLGAVEAVDRLRHFAHGLRKEFPEAEGLTQSWSGNTCIVRGKLRGFPIECHLEVSDSDVTLDSEVPFLARPFQGRIETAVRSGLESALGQRARVS
jgi:hypothetical protein